MIAANFNPIQVNSLEDQPHFEMDVGGESSFSIDPDFVCVLDKEMDANTLTIVDPLRQVFADEILREKAVLETVPIQHPVFDEDDMQVGLVSEKVDPFFSLLLKQSETQADIIPPLKPEQKGSEEGEGVDPILASLLFQNTYENLTSLQEKPAELIISEGGDPLLEKTQINLKENGVQLFAQEGKNNEVVLDQETQINQAMDMHIADPFTLPTGIKSDLENADKFKDTPKIEHLDLESRYETNHGIFIEKLNENAKEGGSTTGILKPITVEPSDPNWRNALIERVHMAIHQDLKSAEIQLHPKELGLMTIHLQMKDNEAFVHFSTNNAEVRSLIHQGMDDLKNQLMASGYGNVQTDVSSGGSYAQKEDNVLSDLPFLENTQSSFETEPISLNLTKKLGLVDYYA